MRTHQSYAEASGAECSVAHAGAVVIDGGGALARRLEGGMNAPGDQHEVKAALLEIVAIDDPPTRECVRGSRTKAFLAERNATSLGSRRTATVFVCCHCPKWRMPLKIRQGLS